MAIKKVYVHRGDLLQIHVVDDDEEKNATGYRYSIHPYIVFVEIGHHQKVILSQFDMDYRMRRNPTDTVLYPMTWGRDSNDY